MTGDLVVAYLDRLRAEIADLPRDEQDELVSSISEHITASLAEYEDPSEVEVRAILDRLGTPSAIAREAHGQSGATAPALAPALAPAVAPALGTGAHLGPPASKPGALEWGGVAMLGIGSYLLPVIGTIAGLVMISLSRWWTTRQKVVAAVLSLFGALVMSLVGAMLLLAQSTPANTTPPGPIIIDHVPAAPSQSPPR